MSTLQSRGSYEEPVSWEADSRLLIPCEHTGGVDETGAYVVMCCTVDCAWRAEADTECAARRVGSEHEEQQPFHITVVISPDEQAAAA